MAAILLIGFMIYESKEMPCGTPVKCQSGGIVIYSGHLNNTAGNTVFVLGPKWRVHMYLHLGTINCEKWEWHHFYAFCRISGAPHTVGPKIVAIFAF